MKKILMVVAQEGFQDYEYGKPREIFESSGIEVKTASLQKGIASGWFGDEIEVDYVAKDIDPAGFDAVVFIGGGGMVSEVKNPDFTGLAKKFFDAGKLVAAICIAPMILANAGLLAGKRATLHESAKKDFVKTGADYTGADVEEDGRFITASGPPAAEKFAKKIIEALG